MRRPVVIFANPIAGRGRGARIAERICRRLIADGYDAKTEFRLPGDSPPVPEDTAAVIAIGGDGTLRLIAAKLYRESRPIPPLLTVPMGTANLMARHLGIRWGFRAVEERVSAALRAGNRRLLDAATANGGLFLLMAGVGIDARIVHELDRTRRGPIDYLSYVLPAATALGFYRYPRLTVMVDGRIVIKDTPAMAFVGNVAEYGTGFPILPDADPTDGLLDVCVVPCASQLELARVFLHAAAGEHRQVEGVISIRGRSIRIDSPEPVPMQVDGEAAGHTPVAIDLLPMRIPFIVPT